jgi:hypothetical protein
MASRRRTLTVLLIVVLVLSSGAFGALCYMMGGPRGAYGFLRFGVWQMHRAKLNVGDRAPDFEAVALDGTSYVQLSQHVGQRPLVLVFGSYT